MDYGACRRTAALRCLLLLPPAWPPACGRVRTRPCAAHLPAGPTYDRTGYARGEGQTGASGAGGGAAGGEQD